MPLVCLAIDGSIIQKDIIEYMNIISHDFPIINNLYVWNNLRNFSENYYVNQECIDENSTKYEDLYSSIIESRNEIEMIKKKPSLEDSEVPSMALATSFNVLMELKPCMHPAVILSTKPGNLRSMISNSGDSQYEEDLANLDLNYDGISISSLEFQLTFTTP